MWSRRIPDISCSKIISLPPPLNSRMAIVQETFTVVESYLIDTSRWYLERRISPSRKSKFLRALGAISIIVGAVLPLLHSVAPDSVEAQWGFVFLALGGGAVLFDRLFGYSASWTRYVKAGIFLQNALADAQIQFTKIYVSMDPESPTDQDIESLLLVISTLRRLASKVVEDETQSWTGYISESVEELTRSTNKGSSIALHSNNDRRI